MSNSFQFLLNYYRQFPSEYVLATIIDTAGSTYQKPGARMLITPDLSSKGVLGGGCFESDLFEHATEVFLTKETKIVRYDTRALSEDVWGLGLGCNGAVTLLLNHFSSFNSDLLKDIEKCLAANIPGVLITVCESDHPQYLKGSHSFIDYHTLKNGNHDEPHKTKLYDVLERREAHLSENYIDGYKVTRFFDYISPPFSLLIIGTGEDVIPVTQFSAILNWQTTIVSHSPTPQNLPRFEQVQSFVSVSPEQLSLEFIDKHDAVILMTHNFSRDSEYLKAIILSDIEYIGLLGPKVRKERLLSTLPIDCKNDHHRIFGPVGLDIGAKKPEEIALAVIAQIHAFFNKKTSSSLSLKEQFKTPEPAVASR